MQDRPRVFREASANRDARVFPASMTFRAGRPPNPHLGFGHGIHFYLGAMTPLSLSALAVHGSVALPRSG